MSMNILVKALLDLIAELKDIKYPLALGGGLGLYLKQNHLEACKQTKTLIQGNFWPPARTTEDIDLLLNIEIVSDHSSMQILRKALDHLGYVSKVDFMQFVNEINGQEVKIDLLTGPVSDSHKNNVKIRAHRVRPIRKVELHAFLTEEAIAYDRGGIEIPIAGITSNGRQISTEIHIPSSFTMMLMKLHAFRDRFQNNELDLAAKHCIDLYRICAMLTKDEYAEIEAFLNEFVDEHCVQDASEICRVYFNSLISQGTLLLRQSSKDIYGDIIPMDFNTFILTINNLFKL